MTQQDGRLVVISNRVGPVTNVGRAGGLAVALVDALKEHGGLWFGWSNEIAGNSLDIRLESEQIGPLTLATIDLAQEDYDEYYHGFANSTLWPLFHYRLDLTRFDRRDYDGYRRVNAKFARGVKDMLQPDDTIWVHDYHFIPLGQELRKAGFDQPMGYFLHIPFPTLEVFLALPNHRDLMEALFAYDLIGFQTFRDLRAFRAYVVYELGGEELPNNRFRAFGRTVMAREYPIGIDADAFAQMAVSDEAQNQYARSIQSLQGRTQIIGVDRLDYTKGLAHRFEAFEQLLESYPENRGAVSLLQVAPPSRSDVEQYQEIRAELEGLSGHINGRFSNFDWTPIHYLNKGFPRVELGGLYRASKVGLITPLRDGMNLVAMEYVAAQDPEDPGVLVLSRFAGAAHQMAPGALIVNPYDVVGVAENLQRAIQMPREERLERWHALMTILRENDVDSWRARFLGDLRSIVTGRGGSQPS